MFLFLLSDHVSVVTAFEVPLDRVAHVSFYSLDLLANLLAEVLFGLVDQRLVLPEEHFWQVLDEVLSYVLAVSSFLEEPLVGLE